MTRPPKPARAALPIRRLPRPRSRSSAGFLPSLASALRGALAPMALAFSAALLLLVPTGWILFATEHSVPLALAVAQLVDPLSLALRATPAYGLPVLFGVLSGLGLLGVLVPPSNSTMPRLRRLAAAALFLGMPASLLPLYPTGVALSYGIALVVLSTLASFVELRRRRPRPLFATAGAAVFATGMLLSQAVQVFPPVLIQLTDGRGQIQADLVTLDPGQGAWLLVSGTAIEAQLVFVDDESIDGIRYLRVR